MKDNVNIALARLNKRYDAIVTYWGGMKRLDVDPSMSYVLVKRTAAIVEHDRILVGAK